MRYVYGATLDDPVAMVLVSGVRYYHLTDALGSTIALVNDAGGLTEKYTYSAYGMGPANSTTPFLYAGRRLDPETGLYHNRARAYSPALGRFCRPIPDMKITMHALRMILGMGFLIDCGGAMAEAQESARMSTIYDQIMRLREEGRLQAGSIFIPELVSALTNANESVAFSAASALHALGCHARAALPELRIALPRYKHYEAPISNIASVFPNGSTNAEIESAIDWIQRDPSCGDGGGG